MSKIRAFFKRVRFWTKLIYDEELMHYAASLSFHTLLSLIPILLLSFSIFTQLPSFDEYYAKIKLFIFSNLLPSHQSAITDYIEQFLANKISLGVFGVMAITITSLMFFSDYEYVVSKIMKLKQKGFWQSFSKYWTLITLAPLGLGFSFYLSSQVQLFLDRTYLTNWINILTMLPYIIIWVIFAISYQVSVDEKTYTKNIIISSFFASLLWNISKFIFVQYSFYNRTYLSLYGSFSILLFFFLWIYIAWIVYLYGLKLCYQLDKKQRNKAYSAGSDCKELPSNS